MMEYITGSDKWILKNLNMVFGTRYKSLNNVKWLELVEEYGNIVLEFCAEFGFSASRFIDILSWDLICSKDIDVNDFISKHRIMLDPAIISQSEKLSSECIALNYEWFDWGRLSFNEYFTDQNLLREFRRYINWTGIINREKTLKLDQDLILTLWEERLIDPYQMRDIISQIRYPKEFRDRLRVLVKEYEEGKFYKV